MEEPTNIPRMRAFLVERRESLRQLYARYRTYGHAMRQKGIVHWSNEKHCFYSEYTVTFYRPKERELIKQLLQLQRNITEQAMLLLELEHAIDFEEKKREEVPA